MVTRSRAQGTLKYFVITLIPLLLLMIVTFSTSRNGQELDEATFNCSIRSVVLDFPSLGMEHVTDPESVRIGTMLAYNSNEGWVAHLN